MTSRIGRAGPLVSAILLTAAGCSHEEPYVRDGRLGEAPAPAPSDIVQRIVLIGDAGAPSVRGEPVLELLSEVTAEVAERTVVVFLGDNIYPAGLPAEDTRGRAAAERALGAQIEAVGDARAVFVPGNHDWANSGPDGFAAIRRQAAWVAAHGNAAMSPSSGCPGPEVHDLPGVRLVTLDTQWPLHDYERGTECSVESATLTSALAPADGRPVVVTGHHPLRSQGPHGGFHSLEEWIVPSRWMGPGWARRLPPLPGLRPLSRYWNRSEHDFISSENRRLRSQLSSALSARPPLVYAAGHEHSLQVFDGGDVASMLVVSGAGSSDQTTPVGHDQSTLFAHTHPGFMVLDIMDGQALLRVLEPGADGAVYWKGLPLR